MVLDQGRNGPGLPLKPSNSAHPSCPSTGLLALPCPLPLRCCVFLLIPFGFFLFQFYFIFFVHFLFFIFIRLCFHFTLFPWQDFVVLVVPRLNEECVQKPVTERTHSEGTSQHKGRRKTAGVSVFSCSVSCLIIKHCCFLPSIASQRYLQTRHLFLFCLFCFPSYYNRNGFVNVLVVWMIRVRVLAKSNPSLSGLRLKRTGRPWRSLTFQADSAKSLPSTVSNPSTQHAKTLHFMGSRRMPQDFEGNLNPDEKGRTRFPQVRRRRFSCSRNKMKPDSKSDNDRGTAG